jgi:putative ABC transport system permease protein
MTVVTLASLREGLSALVINPLRTALSTVGVVMGIASVVATLALADGLEAYSRAQIAAHTDVQAIAVSSRTRIERDGFYFPNAKFARFGIRDASELRTFLGSAAEVTMAATGEAFVAAPTASPHAATVRATLANYLVFGMRDVFAGRYFSDIEVLHNAPVAVLSYRLARDLSPNADPAVMVGRPVRVRNQLMSVVGVMPGYTGETTYEVFIPLRAALTTIDRDGALTPVLLVRAPSIEAVVATEQNVIDWLATRLRDWNRQVSVTTSLDHVNNIRSALLVLKIVMVAFASIALTVGGVGIMNVLLASVMERTREIGVRKALGARQSHILWQFLAEAVAIASAGTCLGTVIGFAGAFSVSAFVRWRIPGSQMRAAVTPGTLLTAIAAAVSVGIIFGTFPALRAARLSPIEAIRHE